LRQRLASNVHTIRPKWLAVTWRFDGSVCERLKESSFRTRSQPANPFTNSTKLRTAMPDGPFAIHGFCSSIHAVPAMSR
jgi:hypothetical protein